MWALNLLDTLKWWPLVDDLLGFLRTRKMVTSSTATVQGASGVEEDSKGVPIYLNDHIAWS